MRFCMVTTFYPPFNFGGDGIYVEALSRELVRRGHEVTVVHCVDAFRYLSGTRADAASDECVDGVRVIRLHSAFGALSPILTHQTGHPVLKSKQLAALLASGFDVVHYHNISLVGGPAVLGIEACGALKLYTLHEHWLLCATHVFWKNRERACERRECLRCCVRSGIPPQAWRATDLVRRSIEHVDALIAPSEFTAILHRASGWSTPVVVIPQFSRLTPAAEYAPAPPAAPYFLYVGRLTASKGVRELVDVFVANPRFELRIAGDGELLAALRERAAAHANVRCLGAVSKDELPALYAGATAVVLPSLAPETFGLSVVEGMAFGTPAIVHDAGGCREVIEASGAGHVFREFSELPALLARLSDDAAHRARLSARARAAVVETYNVERHMAAYLRLIDGLRARKSEGVAA